MCLIWNPWVVPLQSRSAAQPYLGWSAHHVKLTASEPRIFLSNEMHIFSMTVGGETLRVIFMRHEYKPPKKPKPLMSMRDFHEFSE